MSTIPVSIKKNLRKALSSI